MRNMTGHDDDHAAGPNPLEPEVLERGRRVYKVDNTPAEALVIHCADPRFQTAFRRFVVEELELRNYVPLVIGGSAHGLGSRMFLPKNFKVIWEQIKFYTRQFQISQVIIINHEDCHWYRAMTMLHHGAKAREKGRLDLITAARTLVEDFAGIRVRLFWAELDDDTIRFSEVTSVDS